MHVVAYDPFVSVDKARQMGVELLSLDQAVSEADFLTIHLPKTTRDHRSHQSRPAAQGQADDATDQCRPRRHRQRGRLGRGNSRRSHRRRGDRRVRHRAHDGVAAVRPRAGHRHAAPRGFNQRGAGQGRRHHCRHGRSWRSPASSCPSPSTSTRPKPTRRCVRSCRSPNDWSAVRLAGRRARRSGSRCAPKATSPATTPASSRWLHRRASSVRDRRARHLCRTLRSWPGSTASRSARPTARRPPTSSTSSRSRRWRIRYRERWWVVAASSAS